MVSWVYDDGGRKSAGYRGTAADCTCRAIAIATGRPYQEVYDALNLLGKSERLSKRQRKRSTARNGVSRQTVKRYMRMTGWIWEPTMRIGSGCRVHLRADELPKGRLVVSLSRHLCAVIDGVVHDIYDPSRDGTRCVYGYWRTPGNASKPRPRLIELERMLNRMFMP